MWKGLKHPNVLPFLGMIELSEALYLVSPYVENGSADDYIRARPDVDRPSLVSLFRMSVPRTELMASQVLDLVVAAAYLHRSGIVHGDIKAANILISNEGRALLGDFGLSRPSDTATSTEMQGAGSVRWQSPELLQQGGGKSYESDVWALGVTISEVRQATPPIHAIAYGLVTALEWQPSFL